MKKVIVVALVTAAIVGTALAQTRQQCAFIKKNGQQCMNMAKEGSIYCGTHSKF